MENLITIAAFIVGIVIIWTLGYLKGRHDAGVSIGKRYNVTPKPYPFGNEPFI